MRVTMLAALMIAMTSSAMANGRIEVGGNVNTTAVVTGGVMANSAGGNNLVAIGSIVNQSQNEDLTVTGNVKLNVRVKGDVVSESSAEKPSRVIIGSIVKPQ